MKEIESDRDRLLSTSDVARLLNISPDMVRYLERNGKLPAQFVGAQRTRIFKLIDVERLARARAVPIAKAS